MIREEKIARLVAHIMHDFLDSLEPEVKRILLRGFKKGYESMTDEEIDEEFDVAFGWTKGEQESRDDSIP